MNIGLIITIVIIAAIGVFCYFKFIKPLMSGQVAGMYTDAQAAFDEGKEKLIEEYYADPNRFAMFKQVIPDEEIKGVVNFMQPKKVGKTLLSEVATGVTGVRKVNMDMFYIVVTDQHMHLLVSNGENFTSHTQLSLDGMKNVVVERGGRSMKDQVTGQTGDIDKLSFSYKDEDFSYNLYRMFYGFPRFNVQKNFADNGFDHVYLYDTGKVMSKEYHVDFLLHDVLYQGFKKLMEDKFQATFPSTTR